jgi:predicted amidohydrolase YtcJ
MTLVLRNARVIDGTAAPPRDGCTIVVEGERLAQVGVLRAGDTPSGPAVETIDLGGRTVIPGLVEAHMHLSYNNVKVIADLDLNGPPGYSTPTRRGTSRCSRTVRACR